MSLEFAAIIRMTIVLSCAGLATLALKRSSASIRCAVWTVALLTGLLLPLTDFVLPQPARLNLPVLPVTESESVIVKSFVPEAVATVASPAVPAPSANVSWPISDWFAIAWAVGFFYSIGRLITASLTARNLVQRSPVRSGVVWSPLMSRLRNELSISQRVDLRDGGVTPPLTWGLFRQFILLPSNADSWSPEQQRAVLAHELGHAKRYDGLIQFLIQVVCSIYWFNPIVWLAARRLRLERERACDDYAIRAGASAGAYADHLLVLACGGNWNLPVATASVANPSQLERRLRTILNPKTRRGRVSRWTAAALLSSLTAIMFVIAAIHLTSMLSMSLPTSFSVLSAPPATPPIPEPAQRPAAVPRSGTVAGRVLWADGAASSGASVSAIATSREGLPDTWIMGTAVAGTAITDSNGRYRIDNLPPGLYHIVTGPVYLPRTFSDVSRSDSPHLVTVTAGKSTDDLNFTCVRNAGGVVYDSGRMLTVTGKLVLQSFGGPAGPTVLVNNADGSVSHWQFRDSTQSARYWWPGLDAAKGGVIDKMARDGEVVTVTGFDTGGGFSGRWPTLRVLIASEVTRGGVPTR